ncbi:MAG: hypothetical protein AABZ32_03430 [Bacteroidota bacterium]
MKQIKRKLMAVCCVFTLMTFHALSQTTTDSLKQDVEALKEEIRKLRLETAIPKIEMQSYAGLGPAASKVYYSPNGLSIAGYGEITYENYLHNTKTDRGDVLRFVPYFGYKFSDKIIMNSELEIEHAGIGNVGEKEPEVYVEFLYLDFLLHKSFNIRTGLILLPTSMTNEFHEPTVYYGTLRPDVERNIIPTVWREIGWMAHGELSDGLSYKVALTNGMRTDLITDWIGGGRQRGAEINFDKIASSGRLSYAGVKGLNIGVGGYYGQGSKSGGAAAKDTTAQKVATFMLAIADAKYQIGNLSLKALYSFGNASGDTTFEKAGISNEVDGWYAEAGYNLMSHFKSESVMAVSPFVRYEKYNLQKSVFKGTVDDKKNRTVLTVGLDFKPHPQVVIKADYQMRDTKSNLKEGKATGKDENKIDQFNLGVGFIF